jgi:pimeloyl-ACP methyl ester carboxylesterase
MGLLAVPGAELYYETTGSGPLLVLIHGGSGSIEPFGAFTPVLAEHFTVVSYVRRGFDGSPVDGPVDDEKRLATDADDAALVVEQFGGPAAVFGSSSGAIVGLELLSRYPDRVRRLLAHEPPLARLLPNGERWVAFFDRVVDTYHRAGIGPAMMQFGAAVWSLEPPEHEPNWDDIEIPAEQAAWFAHAAGNLGYWMEHEVRPYPRHMPDLAALRPVADRLVPGCGLASRQEFPYQPNLVLARELGLSIVEFPGGHAGYVEHPVEFGTQLAGVLSDA